MASPMPRKIDIFLTQISVYKKPRVCNLLDLATPLVAYPTHKPALKSCILN